MIPLRLWAERKYISMEDNRTIVIDGFEFELTGLFFENGAASITIRVSGNGQSQSDLKGWVLEVCPEDRQAFEELNILSCEKKRRQLNWTPAIALKTSYELLGDIGINGIVITDWVGRYEDDPEAEYRIVIDSKLEPQSFKIGIIQNESVRVSEQKMQITAKYANKVWTEPVEKSFCLYIPAPEGYKPNYKICVSAAKRFTHICCQRSGDENTMPVCARLFGSVRIVASVPLSCGKASGDEVHAAACDCFEVCDIIGYAEEDDAFSLNDVTVYPKKDSLDLTLLNTHCGKSVYRLDGKYVIGHKGE